MRRLLLGVVAASTLLGCTTTARLQQERTYVLEWIGERPLIDDSHATLTLGADGRAYGSASCNHWFGRYIQDGQQLHIEQVGTTRKLCAPALMEQEARYLKALEQVQRWDLSSTDQLRLWSATGQPLRFWPL